MWDKVARVRLCMVAHRPTRVKPIEYADVMKPTEYADVMDILRGV